VIRWITLVSLLCVFALALMLAYANGAIVRLDYLVGSEQVHLSSALLAAAVLGWLLGLVSSFAVVFRLRRENRKLQRSIREAEAEIRNLRSLPFKNER
jgi:lipopolysaccharide assembly protein A